MSGGTHLSNVFVRTLLHRVVFEEIIQLEQLTRHHFPELETSLPNIFGTPGVRIGQFKIRNGSDLNFFHIKMMIYDEYIQFGSLS